MEQLQKESHPGEPAEEGAPPSAEQGEQPTVSSPSLPQAESVAEVSQAEQTPRKLSVSSSTSTGPMSPESSDRVYQYPIRSAVSIDPKRTVGDPNQTPMTRGDRGDGYFGPLRADSRRRSMPPHSQLASGKSRNSSVDIHVEQFRSESEDDGTSPTSSRRAATFRQNAPRLPPSVFDDIVSNRYADLEAGGALHSGDGITPSGRSVDGGSFMSRTSTEDLGGLVTTRFKHVLHDGGHHVITGRDGELQRCEDEPIQCPGAVQGYGLLIALREEEEGRFVVRIVSENSTRMIGWSPRQLFALDNFCDILSEDQADNLMDHVDFVRDEDADLETNGPEVFTMTIKTPQKKSRKLWCALHVSEELNPGLIICEFELEDDPTYPLVPPGEQTPELPEDTLGSNPTDEEYAESTESISRPLRVLRSARKRKSETAAMEVFNIMTQVQEQLAVAPNLEKFLKVLVGVVKELTGFHRVMIYQFDQMFNGRVVTELVDPRATKDLYKGLHFPASDIPSQARHLYKINRVRLLYDRDQETARLVCKTLEDLEKPLDMTHAHLRAMSPIHIKYLANMAVRSSMSISINAFGELWGLIACHTYGPRGMRVSFPIRKMCRLVGDAASRNIERLSYASRLQARKLISTQPTQANPSGYIIASSEDLLKLFDADFGLLSIRDETKILGDLEQSHEALALLEYLRMRKITSVLSSQDVNQDFPDLRYSHGFSVIAGMLVVPLSTGGQDFIVFFRKGQLREVKWAGNPYDKTFKEGTEAYLEPRKSFRTWSEMVIGRCREWSEEEIETAAVLCLVYGKFIEVWRQKEAALENSQLTRLLLANSAHEVRTPLNAIINYLEIALEGSLDTETRENLAKSHSASKSLIYVINDLLDLTKTVEGGDLVKGEVFDLHATLEEATEPFSGDAKRKNITYEVVEAAGVPQKVLGDQRKIRQAISNITANAIQNTNKGGVKVEMYVANWENNQVCIEVSISDTGVGMSSRKLDTLFRELEQVQSEPTDTPEQDLAPTAHKLPESLTSKRALGLGLAVVARIIRNMQGQLRLKSEEGIGSRFVVQFPFELPEVEIKNKLTDEAAAKRPATPKRDASEKTLTYPQSPSIRPSQELLRKNSGESMESSKSLTSLRSRHSGHSGRSVRSDVDRLIEDIQKPTMLDPLASEGSPRRPGLEKRHASYSGPSSPLKARSRSLEGTSSNPKPSIEKGPQVRTPGQETVAYSGFPLKAVKIPDDGSAPPPEDPSTKSGILGEVFSASERPQIKEAPDAKHMRVLVAEDDPVNSKIIKKRLEKLGHDVELTVNGEECASVYSESYSPDCILMDIQMPIVDGIASTKMIRSFEKEHPEHELSTRARLNGRVPIIAVSASLVERERQSYIDTGFDGWILKPISFPRLSTLMEGIVDPKVREEALYQPGQWERGGWFHMSKLDTSSSHAPLAGKDSTREAPGAAKASSDNAPDAAHDGAELDQVAKSTGEQQSRDAVPQDIEGSNIAMTKSAPELGHSGRDDPGQEPHIPSVPSLEPNVSTEQPPEPHPEPESDPKETADLGSSGES